MPGAAASNDGWAAPPLSDLIVRRPSGTGLHPDQNHGFTAPGGQSGAGTANPSGPEVRVVADLLSVRGSTGRFLVPAGSRATSSRSLLSYNRLRPRRVRTARAVIGWALRVGAGGFLAEPRRIEAPADAAVLLDHLQSVLDIPRLVFAATEKGGSGFVTPVLQLFTPDGRSVGFAKLGWDPVTAAMIRTEADALGHAARAGLDRVSVPEVAWHGVWEDLEILVTAPMPARARRLRTSELPPVAPLLDVARLDGPLERTRVTDSAYWSDAVATAAVEQQIGRSALTAHLDTVAADHGDVELAFGRWHGDWVEWNLAKANGRLYAWDWAYSAPGVPFGFDLLQFFHLRHRVLREEPPETALRHAAEDAEPGLAQLGIPGDETGAVIALHRAEVLLREERALQARSEVRQ